MAQPSNNITTLFITDPNGGQPQMIKVMGGAKIPIQLATSSGTTVNSSAVKNLMKSNALQPDQQGATVMQGTKLSSRQLIALPTKQNINLQNIRGPVVLPVSNVQLKSSIQLPVRAATSAISSPMVIRTQTGSLAVASNQVTQSQNQIQLPQINVSKQATSNSSVTPLLQTQIKQNTLGTVTSAIKPANISIKHQLQQAHGDASKPDFVFIPRKNPQDQIQLPTSQSTPSQVAHFMATQQMQQQNNSLNSYPKSFMNTSILDHSSNRKRHDFDFEYNIESKRRKSEKGGKGLRHFSMKVCEKVQAKGTTSYNEVADELVNEFTESTRSQSPSDAISYDQKNIRRRVYDALNVLMAMNIISKEKKEIKWLGLPTNSLQECHKLEQERRNRIQKIKMKTQQLQDLILQQIAFKNLVERNRKVEKDSGAPPPNSAIQLPFIIVNTNKKTVIDCSISNDKTEYLFNFDDTFEIHDDIEVLKRMGMALGLDKGICTPSDVEKAKALVPKALEGYVSELSEGKSCESILSAKGIDTHDAGKVALDDIESSMSDLCGGDFIFENVSVEQSKAGAASRQSSLSLRNLGISEIKEESSSLSRHSSLLSLSQDQRTESESVSSFGEDYDPDIFEDSDVEIS